MPSPKTDIAKDSTRFQRCLLTIRPISSVPDPLRREHQRRNGLDCLSKREGREVEDIRPNGYPCAEVLAAKEAASRAFGQHDGTSKTHEIEIQSQH